MDYSPTNKGALKREAENLVEAGDRIILIHVHVQPRNRIIPALILLEELREMNFSKQFGLTYDPEVLDVLDSVSTEKGYWGDLREKLCDAVEDLKLDSLMVGRRGLGTIKRVLLGSVGNYVVTSASLPW
ncbi:hypothetical protein MLD38_001585 [Melastoma candidum]|uniref:Uncharacterized protein n=1 Tax=Melastoma candidum TaxID=119954 RepID=A0ACB9SDQ7_9MYRT|nr:hypothetical protein MLD38_001585 [Melastoma candidum]